MGSILVVDDDPDILDAVQFVLEDAGYQVSTSQKGENAESLVRADALPQLLILDVLLSGKDGRDICKKLKSNHHTKHLPVIMISAHPDAQRTVLQAGADDFLAKPFDIAQLLAKVAERVH